MCYSYFGKKKIVGNLPENSIEGVTSMFNS